MTDTPPAELRVNGRDYPWPKVPAVVVCLDGTKPACLEAAIEAGMQGRFSRTKPE